jgi:hypothetical protein
MTKAILSVSKLSSERSQQKHNYQKPLPVSERTPGFYRDKALLQVRLEISSLKEKVNAIGKKLDTITSFIRKDENFFDVTVTKTEDTSGYNDFQ